MVRVDRAKTRGNEVQASPSAVASPDRSGDATKRLIPGMSTRRSTRRRPHTRNHARGAPAALAHHDGERRLGARHAFCHADTGAVGAVAVAQASVDSGRLQAPVDLRRAQAEDCTPVSPEGGEVPHGLARHDDDFSAHVQAAASAALRVNPRMKACTTCDVRKGVLFRGYFITT